MSTIDDVKSRLDIIEVVSGYVPELKKAGRTWKARCPFHTERTPSFVTDPERQTWHCFGACSTGGDVIEFVRRIEGLDFREALRRCAERAGVELRPPSQREQEQREQHERLLAANEAAAVFFQAQLRGPDAGQAREYVASRGLDEPALERWQLGYAPAGWRTLTDHLIARGFTEADLVEAGLAVEGDRGAYDRFRDRLVFPTRDQRRRLIGFGARALHPEDEPKYLNTPQTPLFDKSATLYGLDRAADAIRSADQAVVVEGYMDVIAAHQFGIEHVVASNGTAITEKQMGLLKRYASRIVMVLDADAAGFEATERGGALAAGLLDPASQLDVLERQAPQGSEQWNQLIRSRDFVAADVRVARLPAGEDPDSLVRSDVARFLALVEESTYLPEFVFARAEEELGTGDPQARSRLVQALLPTVAAFKDVVVRSHYVQKLARLGQVDEATVMRMLAQSGAAPRARPVATQQEVQQARKHPAAPPDGETQLMRLLLQRPEARGAAIALDSAVFEDAIHHALFQSWVADLDLAERVDELDDDLRERYQELMAAPLPEYEPRHVPEMVTKIAEELRLRRQQARLRTALRDQSEDFQRQRRERQELLGLAVRIAKDGAPPDEAADEHAAAASDFAALTVERVRTAVRTTKHNGRSVAESAAGDPPREDEEA